MSLDNTNTNDLRYFVYEHVNKVNGKRYIGITSREKVFYRWGREGNSYQSQIFGRAIKKYGWDNFEHNILAEGLSQQDAFEMERNLIKKFETTNPKYGYNISIGGDSTTAGLYNMCGCVPVYQYSLEGEFIKAWPSSAEVEREIKIPCYLVTFAANGVSKTAYGYQWSKEFKEHLSPIKRTLANDKPDKIYCYSVSNGKLYKTFDSVTEAKDEIGLKTSSRITSCISGNDFSAYGYRWFKEYKGEFVNVSQENGHCKSVYQYSFDGDFIKEYKSSSVAEKETGLSKTKIVACCHAKIKSCGGYMWSQFYFGKKTLSYKEGSLQPLIKQLMNSSAFSKTKTVYQYDLNHKLIRTFESAQEARKSLGVNTVSGIANCCNGHVKTFRGYIWSYEML